MTRADRAPSPTRSGTKPLGTMTVSGPRDSASPLGLISRMSSQITPVTLVRSPGPRRQMIVASRVWTTTVGRADRLSRYGVATTSPAQAGRRRGSALARRGDLQPAFCPISFAQNAPASSTYRRERGRLVEKRPEAVC
jgi:hypothetical protein